MLLRLWASALAFILLTLPAASGFAAVLGPASSYDELRSLIAAAQDGDTILVSGVLSAQDGQPLSTVGNIRITSDGKEDAVIRGLRLRDASISFSDVSLEDSLLIDGTSHVQLASGVSVRGGNGQSGLSFSGSGTLIVDRGAAIEGGAGGAGVSIEHRGGDFYGSIDGSIRGGQGGTGGAGVEISPLVSAGAIMISGSIQGGRGESVGGHALNLYDLSGNAYITVDGSLQGGDGTIGGDGIQLVSASGSVTVGIGGRVKGGQGESYGGDAIILMNAEGASSVNLSGSFSGGDATGAGAQPGTSLQLVGSSTASRARVMDCILEDGRQLAAGSAIAAEAPGKAEVTPLPEITSDAAQPAQTPAPQDPTQNTPEPAPDAIGEATPSEATPSETPLPDESGVGDENEAAISE